MIPLATDKFRWLIASTSLTTDKLALLTGLSISTIKRWKSGRIRRVRMANLEPVAEALGVLPATLISQCPGNTSPTLRGGSRVAGHGENRKPEESVREHT